MVKPNAHGMTYVAELVASGAISLEIGKRFAWTEVNEALRMQGTGHVRGLEKEPRFDHGLDLNLDGEFRRYGQSRRE